MKKKIVILLCALIAAGAVFSPTASAVDLRINIGDRPYYEYGPEFWDYGWHWVWVPGHREHHRWFMDTTIANGNGTKGISNNVTAGTGTTITITITTTITKIGVLEYWSIG